MLQANLIEVAGSNVQKISKLFYSFVLFKVFIYGFPK